MLIYHRQLCCVYDFFPGGFGSRVGGKAIIPPCPSCLKPFPLPPYTLAFHQVCPTDPHNHAWHLDELARDMQEEEKQPNPVVQRVKTIMALGLIAVHLHSRFFSGVTGFFLGLAPATDGGQEENPMLPVVEEAEEVPLIEYVWWKTFNLSIDQVSHYQDLFGAEH